jgi:hypothetical protein
MEPNDERCPTCGTLWGTPGITPRCDRGCRTCGRPEGEVEGVVELGVVPALRGLCLGLVCDPRGVLMRMRIITISGLQPFLCLYGTF